MVSRDASRIASAARLPTLTRFDLVLLAIPLSFLVGVMSAAVLGHAIGLGVRLGAVLAVVPTAYALFGISPTGDLPRSGSIQ
ncbi:hypothetical protein [Halanaeroarchaeum sulfurireducens]|nr:hypothetical protein [Halanaeroarchaeum sulfurireducens]